MNDLVQRLRSNAQGVHLGADGLGWGPDPSLMDEAADALEAKDAEIERLRKDAERIEDGLHKLRSLAEAYPVEVWPEPSKEEWRRAHEALAAAGLGGIDRFSAANMRHVVTQAGKLVAAIDAAMQWSEG